MTRHHPSLLALRSLLLLLALCALPFAANAQSATATLSGTITDENGAVVPGTQVTVLNVATSMRRETTTNDEGYFVVLLLSPGNYTVRAQHDGFKAVEVREVILNINDEVLLRIQMKVGNVTEVVDVTGEASLIDESPAVGTVVDRQFVENLPLNGRSFQSLVTLTPGVVLSKSTGTNPGQFIVNGQRSNANYFTIDGVSANIGIATATVVGQGAAGSVPSFAATGGTNNLVSIDALQEFKIQTSTYAAEFGRTPGGQVQIVTRAGTNTFRGTLFEYFRNDKLDATDWFVNANKLTKPPLRQNDFGGVFGGPIIKNRTFFFFSYEGLRLRQPLFSIKEVPSVALRTGAPSSLQPFLNAYPIPNGPTFSTGLAQFSASYSNPSQLDATSIRIDHNISNRFTMFGRYNTAPSQITERGTSARSLNVLGKTTVDTQTFTAGTTWTFSPSVINDLRFNYSTTKGSSIFSLDNFGGAAPLSDTQVFPSFARDGTAQTAFTLRFGARPELRVGPTASNEQRQVNIVDSISLLRGNHNLKFGVDYRRLAPTYGFARYFLGITFNSVAALNSATVSTAQVLTQQETKPVFTNFSAFGQDTWKTTKRLTLTYGLRWEVNPPPSEANGNDPFAFTGFDNLATLAPAARGTPLYATTYNNFAPRFGIAYALSQDPGHETVLRGGLGIFFDIGIGSAADVFDSFPFQGSKLTSNTPYPLLPSVEAPPVVNLNTPFPTVTVFNPKLKLPRVYQWNLAIERSLGSHQTISASYVGALGRRLLRSEGYLAPNPNFSGFVVAIKNAATSDYHSMQLQYQRHLSRGLQALASYTWSHSIDEASDDLLNSGQDLARGDSNFDRRHVFVGAITYDLPTPSLGWVGKVFFKSWAIDSFVRAHSATPVNIIATSNIVSGVVLNIRPDLTTGIPLYINDPTVAGGRKFNNTIDPSRPGCKGPFCPPPTSPLRQGTLGRNALRGFPMYQLDLALRRQFSLSERLRLQFRAEVFNVFNHPNFADPDGNLGSGTFGLSTTMLAGSLSRAGGGLNALYQIGGPRTIQFALKLSF